MSISIQSRKGQILPGQNLYISIGKRRSSIPINPDIINYIQNVQNDKDKDKLRQNEQKKNSSQNKYEQIVTRKIKGQSQNLVFKEDMTTDKDKRFNAKKGLLFLLNNLSKGTFCPDIEEYFKKMKEKKVEEFKNKINDDINNFNIIDELDKKERKKKGRDSSIKKLINTLAENEINNIEFNNKINYNFKKKKIIKISKNQSGLKNMKMIMMKMI